MNKLTADECRLLINGLSGNRTIREDKYLAALEIALPILEQQEVKSILLTDFKCEEDESYPVYECHECRLNQLPEERRVSDVTGRTKCPRCECLQFTRRIVDFSETDEPQSSTSQQQERGEGEWIEWGGGNRPVPYGTMVDVRFRDGNEGMRPAGGYRWDKQGFNNDIIAYRIIPEQPTNQNGEQ